MYSNFRMLEAQIIFMAKLQGHYIHEFVKIRKMLVDRQNSYIRRKLYPAASIFGHQPLSTFT